MVPSGSVAFDASRVTFSPATAKPGDTDRAADGDSVTVTVPQESVVSPSARATGSYVPVSG
jgi:hypothetical protein